MRDEWVIDRAGSVVPGSRVLDVGAGTAPYKDLFKHCEYFTQDFAQYEGYKGVEGQYAEIDYVSDIADIPAPDASFDVVLCTEV
ncbi:class I SAM-dependent methyltransferase, partial [Acinetobacter baumannii]